MSSPVAITDSVAVFLQTCPHSHSLHKVVVKTLMSVKEISKIHQTIISYPQLQCNWQSCGWLLISDISARARLDMNIRCSSLLGMKDWIGLKTIIESLQRLMTEGLKISTRHCVWNRAVVDWGYAVTVVAPFAWQSRVRLSAATAWNRKSVSSRDSAPSRGVCPCCYLARNPFWRGGDKKPSGECNDDHHRYGTRMMMVYGDGDGARQDLDFCMSSPHAFPCRNKYTPVWKSSSHPQKTFLWFICMTIMMKKIAQIIHVKNEPKQ